MKKEKGWNKMISEKRIKRELGNAKRKGIINDWKAIIIRKEKRAIYLTNDYEVECESEGEREEAVITTYTLVENKGDKKIGERTFTINDDKELDEERIVLEARESRKSTNPYYEITSKKESMIKKESATRDDKIIKVMSDDEEYEKEKEKIIKELKESIKKEREVRFTSAELIMTRTKIKLINSRRVSHEKESTNIYLETVLTSRTNEHLATRETTRIRDLKIREFIKEEAKIARDSARAEPLVKKVKKPITTVLISGKAVEEFFNPHLGRSPLIFHAIGKIKHMGLSNYETGKKVVDESITIKTNPFKKYNPSSSEFDDDGTASKEVTVIKKGVFQQYLSNKQYASYLGVEPTGAIGVISVKRGKESSKELIKKALKKEGDKAVEIISFSSFTPNDTSGDFSAEIRVGYLYQKKKNKIIKEPIRNAMFSGNMFRLRYELSRDKREGNGYEGPETVLVNEGVVSGVNI